MEKIRIVFFIFIFIFGNSPLWDISLINSWFDQQRVAQLLLIVLACSALPWTIKFSFFNKKIHILILAIFFIGFISSIFSKYPFWALKEWGKSAGLLLTALGVAYFSRNENFTKYLLILILAISFLLGFEFLNFYIAGVFSEIKNISPYLLFTGFDNPRFYAQGVLLFMPFTAFLATTNFIKHKAIINTAIVTTIFQWMVLIALAGRGAWVAAAFAYGVAFFYFSEYRTIIKKQIVFIIYGIFLYIFLFYLVPFLFFPETGNLPSGLRSGLSAREKIWSIAWDMALQNPWLGVGPLHFSSVRNPIAAHPHQAILQWLAEWGVIATILALIIIYSGIKKGFNFIKNNQEQNLDLAVWIAFVSALVLAQVDGVFVTPYSEGWFAIIAGLGIRCWGNKDAIQNSGIKWIYIIIACFVFVIVSYIVLFEAPNLYSNQGGFLKYSIPRFWMQGWIPMESH